MMSVCDQDGTNVSAVHQLVNLNMKNSKSSKTGVLSYRIGAATIIHCYDPPHLIKGIRNNLMTKYLKHGITKRWNISETGFNKNIQMTERCASWDDVKHLYDWSNGSSMKLLPKITPEHIKPEKSKMRVSVATQVFSATCGNMLLKYSNDTDLPLSYDDTAEVLLFFNDVFDSINGSCLYGDNELKGPVTEKSVHFAFWNYALAMLSTMKFLNKETGVVTNRSPVIRSFQSTILGYMEISKQCLNLNMTKISLRYYF